MKKTLLFSFILFAIAMKSFIVFAQIPAYIPASGLQAWYPFTANSNDSSGMGNNLTGSASYVTDRFGQTNAAVTNFSTASPLTCTFPSFSFGYDSALTASAWVKFIGYTGSGGAILKSYPTSDANFIFGIFAGNTVGGGVNFGCLDNASWAWSSYAYSFPLNEWINLVGVYNSGSMSLYVNSQLVATQTLPVASPAPAQQPFWVGYDLNDWTATDSTVIDDIGIWNRSLAACEIAKLYFSTTSLITNQVANDTVVTGTTAHFTITDTGGAATYQWQQNSGAGFANLTNGGAYSGVTTKTLVINPVTAVMNNYLYRCIRNGSPCSDTSNAGKLLIHSTEVDNVHLNEEISLSPNPAQNSINIKSSLPIKEVVICDMVGQQVFSGIYDENNVTIGLEQLPQGIYIVKVNGDKVFKVIKQ